MEKETKIWIIVLAAVVLLGCGFLVYTYFGADGGCVAILTVDGEEIDRIDLSKVKDSYDIQIDTPWGHNTVRVEPGRISVTDADCPDGICVQRGAISGAGIPIICMPHRLIIEIEGGELYV